MTTLNTGAVAGLTQNLLVQGYVKLLQSDNPLMQWLPKFRTDRPAVTLIRESTLGSTAYNVDCSTTLTNSAASGGPVSFNLQVFERRVDTCNIVQNTFSSFIDQQSWQIDAGFRLMGHDVAVSVLKGDGSTTGVLGMESLNTNVIAASANGGALSLEAIDALYDQIRSVGINDPSNVALVMNFATRRKFLTAMRSAASNITYEQLEGMDFQVPVYQGNPILVNNDLTGTGNIYVVKRSTSPQDNGLALWFGENKSQWASLDGLMYISPDIRTASNNDVTNHIQAQLALSLGSTQAIARLVNWNS
jgi:hypothetical protein